MRTILSIYLVDFLLFSETVSASLYHGFAAMCYFTPVIGAIIADSFLGNDLIFQPFLFFFVTEVTRECLDGLQTSM